MTPPPLRQLSSTVSLSSNSHDRPHSSCRSSLSTTKFPAMRNTNPPLLCTIPTARRPLTRQMTLQQQFRRQRTPHLHRTPPWQRLKHPSLQLSPTSRTLCAISSAETMSPSHVGTRRVRSAAMLLGRISPDVRVLPFKLASFPRFSGRSRARGVHLSDSQRHPLHTSPI